MVTYRNNTTNYQKDLTTIMHDLLFAWGNVVIPAVPADLGPETASNQYGGCITKVNEWWKLLIEPVCTPEVAKELGFIHDPKPKPDPATLVADSHVICDGALIKVFTIMPALLVTAQEIRVDKHDEKGWQLVNATEHSHYEYAPDDLPAKPTMWTYKILYRVDGHVTGQPAVINVPVWSSTK
jgi:hypothetical protein